MTFKLLINYIAFRKVYVTTLSSLFGSYVDIFPYMGTRCLNINCTSCIVGTVSVVGCYFTEIQIKLCRIAKLVSEIICICNVYQCYYS